MQRRLALSQIVPNADQPRKLFEPGALAELAASILENGLAQPITVRPLPSKGGAGVIPQPMFEIVMGERRFRAHCRLVELGHTQFNEVLCNVKVMDETTRDINAILENLQRVDVTPLEEAYAFGRLLDAGMRIEDLAAKIGVAPFRIRERTQLLNLAPVYLKMLEAKQLDKLQAFEISRLASEADQTRIVKMIGRGSITGWKAVRAAVDAILDDTSQEDMFGEAAPKASDEDVKAVNRMEEKIETMARLAATGWKDGECVIAAKVSRDRAALMAEKLKAMRGSLLAMERELRMVGAQAEIVMA